MEKPVPFSRNVIKESGMRGIGEQYKTLTELAAQRTGLSTEQIKVMISVQNLTLIILLSVDEVVMSNMYKNGN